MGLKCLCACYYPVGMARWVHLHCHTASWPHSHPQASWGSAPVTASLVPAGPGQVLQSVGNIDIYSCDPHRLSRPLKILMCIIQVVSLPFLVNVLKGLNLGFVFVRQLFCHYSHLVNPDNTCAKVCHNHAAEGSRSQPGHLHHSDPSQSHPGRCQIKLLIPFLHAILVQVPSFLYQGEGIV